MRIKPERLVTPAIVAVCSAAGVGIEDSAHDPITFHRALADQDLDALVRAVQERHGVYFRLENVTTAGPSNVGEMRLRLEYGAYYYHVHASQEKAEQSAFDVLFALAQVVGEERAKPGGATGTSGKFGLGGSTGRNYVFDVYPDPIGAMKVTPLDTGDDASGNDWTVKGEYHFAVGFILNINGGLDS